MVQLETREREESNNGSGPCPQEQFEYVEAIQTATNIIEEPTKHNARPWQQRRCENPQVEPRGRSAAEPVRCVQTNVLVQQIAVDEGPTKASQHVDKPRERDRNNQREA